MAFEDFLNHTCDIYHVQGTAKSPGFGLTAAKDYKYPETPDIANAPCHFAQGGSGGTVNTVQQREPNRTFEERIKLVLPVDTDIRVNDKIIDHRTGYVYTAEIPRTVRTHHIYVFVNRDGSEASL
ncbi:MAG: DUF3599 family protein [Alphaproteobacteria bacterium]|nr:DUF3599 family protein [Alphaproteobacteria bacterium]